MQPDYVTASRFAFEKILQGCAKDLGWKRRGNLYRHADYYVTCDFDGVTWRAWKAEYETGKRLPEPPIAEYNYSGLAA